MIGEIYGKLPDMRSFKEIEGWPSIYAGVEFEIEGLQRQHLERKPSWYEVKPDGTLRGEYTAELVFAKPLFGKDMFDALDQYDDWLAGGGEASKRTSTHVHIDVRQLEEQEYCTYVAMVTALEPVLYILGGVERTNGPYCYSTLLDWRCVTDWWQDVTAFEKYQAVNLKATAEKGSIEFRMHRGCTATHQLRPFLFALLNMRNSLPYTRNPMDTLTGLYSGRLDYLEFATKAIGFITDLSAIDREIARCCCAKAIMLLRDIPAGAGLQVTLRQAAVVEGAE